MLRPSVGYLRKSTLRNPKRHCLEGQQTSSCRDWEPGVEPCGEAKICNPEGSTAHSNHRENYGYKRINPLGLHTASVTLRQNIFLTSMSKPLNDFIHSGFPIKTVVAFLLSSSFFHDPNNILWRLQTKIALLGKVQITELLFNCNKLY
jgi:hypothetical protein